MPEIKTEFVHPAAPIANHTWCAFWDGEEETQRYGWGETEAEAIEDLKANYPKE